MHPPAGVGAGKGYHRGLVVEIWVFEAWVGRAGGSTRLLHCCEGRQQCLRYLRGDDPLAPQHYHMRPVDQRDRRKIDREIMVQPGLEDQRQHLRRHGFLEPLADLGFHC
jgi:hypothetical protein